MGNLKDLSNPFPPEDVEWFIGVTNKDKTQGMAIPFITNRAVQDRLDEVCGIEGWRNEYKSLGDRDIIGANGELTAKKSSQLCGISVWSEIRKEWITKWDGAEESDIEAIKGSLSSAMKRAAVQFGIGRYLYKLESPWVAIEQRGRSYVMKADQKIIMPPWAMPGASGTPGPNDSRKPTVQTIGYNAPPQQAPQPAPQQSPHYPYTAPPQPAPKYTYPAPSQPAPQQAGRAGTLSDKQVNRALRKGEAAGQTEANIKQWIMANYGVDEIKNLNRQQYDELCAALDRNRIQ